MFSQMMEKLDNTLPEHLKKHVIGDIQQGWEQISHEESIAQIKLTPWGIMLNGEMRPRQVTPKPIFLRKPKVEATQ